MTSKIELESRWDGFKIPIEDLPDGPILFNGKDAWFLTNKKHLKDANDLYKWCDDAMMYGIKEADRIKELAQSKEVANILNKNPDVFWQMTLNRLKKDTMESKDPIVEEVVNSLRSRSDVGISKYGTSLHENNTDDFLQHLQEELMDAVLYIQKLKTQRNG